VLGFRAFYDTAGHLSENGGTRDRMTSALFLAAPSAWPVSRGPVSGGLFVSASLTSLPVETNRGPSRVDTPSIVVANELRKLLQHSSHYLSGIVISLALGFISFPIFTRVFSVSDYGTIELVAKVLLLLTALSKMGLQQSALRFYDGQLFSSDPSSARRYYSTMFWGMALTATFVMLLFWAGVEIAPKSVIDRKLAGLLSLVGILILVRALGSLLLVFVRLREMTKLYSIFTATTKVATLAAICLFIPWLGRSVQSYYTGTVLVEVVVAIILSAILLPGGLVELRAFDLTLFRTGLAFGLPLIFYELSSIALDAGDRVLVRHYLGANALGFYSVAYGMADYVNNLLIVPINLALAPIYIRLWTAEGPNQTSEFLSRGLDLFLMASAGILAVVTATCHDAVTLLASPKFRGADVLLPTLVAGLLLYTSHAFLAAGLMIHKDTRTMAKLLAYAALFNIGLNCLLLPRIGLQAAALATLLSYLFCVVLLGRASSRLLPLRINFRTLVKYAVASGFAWYAASHIELGTAIANLAARSASTLVLYGGILFLLDSRIRTEAARLFGRRA
jgi:O-antigen/teichoic acid export membrane protein